MIYLAPIILIVFVIVFYKKLFPETNRFFQTFDDSNVVMCVDITTSVIILLHLLSIIVALYEKNIYTYSTPLKWFIDAVDSYKSYEPVHTLHSLQGKSGIIYNYILVCMVALNSYAIIFKIKKILENFYISTLYRVSVIFNMIFIMAHVGEFQRDLYFMLVR